MNKTTIIKLILTRAMKEYKCFNSFKKCYNEIRFISNSFFLCDTLESMSISSMAAYDYRLYNCIDKAKKDIHDILFDLLQKYIMNYLEITNLKNEFEINLRRVRFCYYNSGAKTIDEYIKYLKINHYSPFDFFIRAFSWAESTKNFSYWKKINMDFRRSLLLVIFRNIK